MKKIALFMMILTCCMFFGCGKSSPLSNEFILLSISDSGTYVSQALYFSVGTNKLKNQGLSEEQIAAFKNKLIKNVNMFHDEFYISLILAYNSNPNPLYQIGKAVVVTQTAYNEENDCVGFTILFKDKATWSFYHPTSNEEVEPNLGFMITASSTGNFPFAENISSLNKTVGQRYMDAYTNALEGLEIVYSPDFIYDYATSNRALKSDSNYYLEDQLYHHIWLKNQNEYKDSTITLYISQPNRGLWMLTFVLATFAAFGLYYLVIQIKKRKIK